MRSRGLTLQAICEKLNAKEYQLLEVGLSGVRHLCEPYSHPPEERYRLLRSQTRS